MTPGNKGNKSDIQTEEEEGEQQAKRRGMSWAQRLKRVFGIDIEVCPHCGDGVRIIACIEDPVVIRQILSHVETKQEQAENIWGQIPSLIATLLLTIFASKGTPDFSTP